MTLGVTVPPQRSRLTVRIWDRFGDFVTMLVDERDPRPGRRELTWVGDDGSGEHRPPGYYIWRVTVDGVSESRLTRLQ